MIEPIYAFIIILPDSLRDINFVNALACELAAYPPSVFNPYGEIKISKSKSTLTQKLQVTVSEHNCPIQNTIIYYDVSALP